MTIAADSEPALAQRLDRIWELLASGRGGFRTPVIGTRSAVAHNLRTVVLREVDRDTRHLSFHTDIRSSKVEALCIAPRLDWLFYDDELRVQLRAAGPVVLHTDDELADAAWDEKSPRQRTDYAAESPPSSVADRPGGYLPHGLTERQPTDAEAQIFRQHFAVVRCQLDHLDWLELGDDGHVRTRFLWHDDAWQADWLIP